MANYHLRGYPRTHPDTMMYTGNPPAAAPDPEREERL
jgi:hypothetical protein